MFRSKKVFDRKCFRPKTFSAEKFSESAKQILGRTIFRPKISPSVSLKVEAMGGFGGGAGVPPGPSVRTNVRPRSPRPWVYLTVPFSLLFSFLFSLSSPGRLFSALQSLLLPFSLRHFSFFLYLVISLLLLSTILDPVRAVVGKEINFASPSPSRDMNSI